MTSKETVKIVGYSVGDSSVGIGSIGFEVDTGLHELDDNDKKFLIEYVVGSVWELHDNGTLYYDFTDEVEDEWGFRRKYDEETRGIILKTKMMEKLE